MVTVRALISLKSQSVIKTMVFYCYLLQMQMPGCAEQLPNAHGSCSIENSHLRCFGNHGYFKGHLLIIL